MLLVCLFVLSPLLFSPACLRAQPAQIVRSAAQLGVIAGRVVDERTNRPLVAALVLLEWHVSLAVPDEDIPAEFLRPGRRRAISDSAGLYEFAGLPRGRYSLKAQRIDYAPREIDVILALFETRRVGIGLSANPFDLDPVTILERNPQSYVVADSRFADSVGVRGIVERRKQFQYIAPDVRELTGRDVAEAVTLAETDIFRALQRSPGVGTRDDYTSVLWTRGAPWDQTRVYFDGVPLYNPTHAGWLFSSVNPEGIGSATFFPGVRPASSGEGAAGILDLGSRAGGRDGPVRASADLSLVSARVSADGELPWVDGGWMLAGRRTYVDWFTSAMNALGSSDVRIPYEFSDVIGRVDSEIGLGFRIEASGIHERDHLRGDFPGVLARNQASWGNRAGRVTLVTPVVRGVESSLTMGATRFGTQLLEEAPFDSSDVGATLSAPAGENSDPTLPSLENALRHTSQTIVFSHPRSSGAPVRWSFGVQFSHQRAEYDGPFSLTAEGVPGVDRGQMIRIPFTYQSELRTRAAWAQKRVDVGSRVNLDLGIRAERGVSVLNGGRTRLAPRAAGRVMLDSSTSLSAGWSRSFQYAQDVGAAAGPLGPQLHLTHIWLLSRGGVPAIRADIATAGVERWLNREWLVAMNLYQRDSRGVTLPDPTPGEIRGDRPLFEVADNSARGLELSARKLAGRWTGSAGYSYAVSNMNAAGLQFASPADVRHGLDASGSVSVADRWRLSGAFSYASGVPFTRLIVGETTLRLGDPYAMRTPSYASADVSVEYRRPMTHSDMSIYLQVRNVLNRNNSVTYAGSRESCVGTVTDGVCAGSLRTHDRFDSGIPILPLAGIRFVF